MIKLLFLMVLIIGCIPVAKAQLDFITKPDYTISYIGFWTANPLYEIRDTSDLGAPTHGLNSIFKINTNLFQVKTLRTALAIGTMLPATFLCANDTGLIVPVKKDSVKWNWTQVTGKPSIPAGQVSSDWNSVSGVSQILNKPTIPTNNNQLTNGAGYFTAEVDGSITNEIQTLSGTGRRITLTSGGSYTVPLATWDSVTSKPTFATVATTGSYNDLSNKPTIVTYTAGTGISLGSNVVTNTAPDQTVSLTGANGIVTSGTYPGFTISQKRQETYSGTTNASGIYTVTFSVSYSVAPNIQANIVGGSNTNLIKITSVSTTAFTVTVVNRVDVLGLLPSYSNVNGASVDVLITEK